MWQDKKHLFSNIQRLAVVGVSDWITNEARESFLAYPAIITRIYNWVDLEIFRPIDSDILRQKHDVKDKFIILGVASGWSNDKGLNKFIELADIIPDDMIIVLVGNIDSNIPLPSNVIHIEETGSVNELAGYYSLADVLANFSMEETFGKVSAEALACGTPVITYRSTANPELVGDGCGYVLDNNDIRDINKTLSMISQNGKQHYSGKCVAFAQANFNKRDRIEDYRTLYTELIKNETGRNA
jgi:glycosyltransferase involved in cell wall biosynthesis